MLGINITPLKPGLHEVALTPSAEALGLDPEVFSAVTVDARLDHDQDRTFVAFTARATATLVCDRTAVTFEQPVEGTYAVLFVLPERLGDLGDAGDDDVRPLPPAGAELDITDAVRDTLLLALPSRRVAPGAEDEDLPVSFGAERDEDGAIIDPRWAALQKLRDSQ
jgi:uncharacterized protein